MAQHRAVPEDIQKKLELVAANFAVTTGATTADIQDFMNAILQILGEYIMRLKEKVH